MEVAPLARIARDTPDFLPHDGLDGVAKHGFTPAAPTVDLVAYIECHCSSCEMGMKFHVTTVGVG
jgi:hypothetical protein